MNTKDKDSTDLLNVDDSSNNSVRYYIDKSLISTRDDNRSGYTCHSHPKTQLACKIQHIIRRPSTQDYKHYVANNDMVECPILLSDVNSVEDIF